MSAEWEIEFEQASKITSSHIKEFMLHQTREKDLALFVQISKIEPPQGPMDIPFHIVVPSFIISEFRTAFEIGCLIFIPFFLVKNQCKALFACLAIIGAGYLPFFVWGQADPISVFTGLGIYMREWSINGFIFEFIHSMLSIFDSDQYILSKTICAGTFTVVWLFIFYKN